MRSGRIEYRAEVAVIVLTSALLVKKETRDCMFMSGVPSLLLVRERLDAILNPKICPPNLLCTMTLPGPTADFDSPARVGISVNTARQDRHRSA